MIMKFAKGFCFMFYQEERKRGRNGFTILCLKLIPRWFPIFLQNDIQSCVYVYNLVKRQKYSVTKKSHRGSVFKKDFKRIRIGHVTKYVLGESKGLERYSRLRELYEVEYETYENLYL